MPGAYIPDDWDGVSYCCYSVRWPDSFEWRAALNGLVSLAGSGWYWNEETGSVVDARDAIRATWDYNFDNEVVLMTCSDTSNDILEQIKDAIQALVDKECCPPPGGNSGSRGIGTTGQPPNPYDEAITPTTPPPGFDTMEEYDTRKCQAANDIINNLGSDLVGLSGMIYAGKAPTSLVSALIVIMLTPVPYDDLIALAAYLIYSAYSYTFLAEMASAIDENRDDLLCILYSADSAEGAKTDFMAKLEEIAEGQGWAAGTDEWVMGAIEYIIDYDTLNILFVNLPTVSTDADCSECAECQIEIAVISGTPWGSGTLPANPMVITGVDIGGVYRLAMCLCGENIRISLSGYNAAPSSPGANDAIGIGSLECGDPGATYDLYLDDDAPSPTFDFNGVGQLTINSTTEHVATITIA